MNIDDFSEKKCSSFQNSLEFDEDASPENLSKIPDRIFIFLRYIRPIGMNYPINAVIRKGHSPRHITSVPQRNAENTYFPDISDFQ